MVDGWEDDPDLREEQAAHAERAEWLDWVEAVCEDGPPLTSEPEVWDVRAQARIAYLEGECTAWADRYEQGERRAAEAATQMREALRIRERKEQEARTGLAAAIRALDAAEAKTTSLQAALEVASGEVLRLQGVLADRNQRLAAARLALAGEATVSQARTYGVTHQPAPGQPCTVRGCRLDHSESQPEFDTSPPVSRRHELTDWLDEQATTCTCGAGSATCKPTCPERVARERSESQPLVHLAGPFGGVLCTRQPGAYVTTQYGPDVTCQTCAYT